MLDKKQNELALRQLGRVLEETRGMGRRAFLKRLGQVAVGAQAFLLLELARHRTK